MCFFPPTGTCGGTKKLSWNNEEIQTAEHRCNATLRLLTSYHVWHPADAFVRMSKGNTRSSRSPVPKKTVKKYAAEDDIESRTCRVRVCVC